MNFSKCLFVTASAAAFLLSAGCAEYFGTNEGFEEGDTSPWATNNQFDQYSDSATFDMIGISPTVAQPGDTVTVYASSDEGAETGAFAVDDFWFCTFDGESAMLETGGNDYSDDATEDDNTNLADIENTLDLEPGTLDGSTVSTVDFTVPEGTVTGEGLFFNPYWDTQSFQLSIQ